jgi:hypothetical protein
MSEAAPAAPAEPKDEPVARIVGTSDVEGKVHWCQPQRVELGTFLYLRPGLTAEQIDEAMRLADDACDQAHYDTLRAAGQGRKYEKTVEAKAALRKYLESLGEKG